MSVTATHSQGSRGRTVTVIILRTPPPRVHSLSHCPTRPTQPLHTESQSHTVSRTIPYTQPQGGMTQNLTHCSSQNMFFMFIHSPTIQRHTQRPKVSPPQANSHSQ